MKSLKIQGIALFMILLIVTFPLSSINVSATTSFTAYALDSQGTQNYRSSNDNTTFVAQIPGTGMAPSSVTVTASGYPTSIPFTSCSASGTNTLCTYTPPQTSWNPGEYDFLVSYQGTNVDVPVIVDDIAPNVTITTMHAGSSGSVSYSVQDFAYNTNANQCSGVNSVSFSLGGTKLNTTLLGLQPGNCIYQGTQTLQLPSTNGQQENFCIQATDNVGNSGTTCEPVVVDTQAPSVSGLILTDTSNNQINYISGSLGIPSAVLKFSMNEFNFSTGVADASAFATQQNLKSGMKSLPVVCSPSDCEGTCTCQVAIPSLDLPQGGNPTVHLYLNDSSGNYAESDLSTTLTQDNTAPILVSLTASQCGSNVLGPSNNTIVATLNEAGSGFNARKIYLNLVPVLGSGYDHVQANTCAQSGSQWICTWGTFPVLTTPSYGTNLAIDIASGSSDDAGNPVQYSPTTFFYANQPPSLNSSVILAAQSGTSSENIQAYPVSGGTVQVILTSLDNLPVSATADFSTVAYSSAQTVACTSVSNTSQTCTFPFIGPLYNGPLFNQQIPVALTDCVGNTNVVNIPINISVLSTTSNDYWTYSVGPQGPSQVDREFLSQFPQYVYIPIIAAGSSADTPISQTLDCSASNQTNLNYLGNSAALPNRLPVLFGDPSTTPYVQLLFQATTIPDSVPYSCTITTITRTQGGYISQPEYDNFTFNVSFYDSAYGTLDQAAQAKINAVKNEPLVSGGVIGDISSVFTFATNFCNAWAGIQYLLNGIDAAGTVLGAIADITGVLKGAAQGFQNTVMTPLHDWFGPPIPTTGTPAASPNTPTSFGDIVTKICKYVSCDNTFLPGVQDAINKYQGAALLQDANGKPQKVDVKSSLVLSMATLCIPGIIYNLQKARAIDCAYVVCMQQEVPKGVPPYECDFYRATDWCLYVFGEIFQIIPFNYFTQAVINYIKNAPSYAVSYGLNLAYTSWVLPALCGKTPDLAVSSACYLGQDLPRLISVIADLSNGKTWNTIKNGINANDVCGQIQWT